MSASIVSRIKIVCMHVTDVSGPSHLVAPFPLESTRATYMYMQLTSSALLQIGAAAIVLHGSEVPSRLAMEEVPLRQSNRARWRTRRPNPTRGSPSALAARRHALARGAHRAEGALAARRHALARGKRRLRRRWRGQQRRRRWRWWSRREIAFFPDLDCRIAQLSQQTSLRTSSFASLDASSALCRRERAAGVALARSRAQRTLACSALLPLRAASQPQT